MPFVLLHWGLFSDSGDRGESEESILYLLEVNTDRNCRYLEKNPSTVKLYDSDIVYALPDQMTKRPDPGKLARVIQFLEEDMGTDPETVEAVSALLQGIEMFRDIPTVLAKKEVDCDNLACFRCAELRRSGVKAMPYIVWRETANGTTYHALVRWPDGSSEDPSILLGMGGEGKAVERAEERRKNKERFDTFVAAAKGLCDMGNLSKFDAGKKIDSLGLIPRSGKW